MSTEAAPKVFELSHEEVTLVLNMIAACSKRGAFHPQEFKMIGSFFDKYAPLVAPPEEDKKEDKEEVKDN